MCKVAVRILLIPSSSAASACNWSTFSYINEKKRNCLTDERLFKLVYIYSNYKLNCLRQEFSDTTEAVTRFNNKLIQQNSNCVKNDIILLDPIENDNDSNENDSMEDENEELFKFRRNR